MSYTVSFKVTENHPTESINLIHEEFDCEIITLYRCAECNEVSQEVLDDVLYECGECSGKFTKSNGLGRGHICPECTNKMGSRISDQACADCEAGEVEELPGTICGNCNEELVADDADALVDHFKECLLR